MEFYHELLIQSMVEFFRRYYADFLPEKTYIESARVLDKKRLGKQRVEAMQILTSLTHIKWDNYLNRTVHVSKYGWSNHPATKMWRGNEFQILQYIEAICQEWCDRGGSDTCLNKSREIFKASHLPEIKKRPSWYSDRISSTHRQVLLFKEYDWYKQFDWSEKPKHEYYWPV